MVFETQTANENVDNNKENQDRIVLDSKFSELAEKLRGLNRDINYKDNNGDNVTIHHEDKEDGSTEIGMYKSADKENPVTFEGGILSNCASFFKLVKGSDGYRLYRNNEEGAENGEVISDSSAMDHLRSIDVSFSSYYSITVKSEIELQETAFERSTNNADELMYEIMNYT